MAAAPTSSLATVAIDFTALPGRALVDSGVVMRAMGDFPEDSRSAACKAFYEAMLLNNREILIAAPTVTEVMRKDGKRQIPRTRLIEIVAFDQPAAELLGKVLQQDVLKEVGAATGLSLTHLKYDAMIVACAARYNAECIGSIDGGFEKLAARFEIPIPVYGPSHYLASQTTLALPPSSPTPNK